MSCFNLSEVNAKLVPLNFKNIANAEKSLWKEKFCSHVIPSLSPYVNVERYGNNTVDIGTPYLFFPLFVCRAGNRSTAFIFLFVFDVMGNTK